MHMKVALFSHVPAIHHFYKNPETPVLNLYTSKTAQTTYTTTHCNTIDFSTFFNN